jgi:hypothetical protein
VNHPSVGRIHSIDPNSDVDAQIEKALQAIESDLGGVLFFGVGEFHIKKGYQLTLPEFSSFAIYGLGPGSSKLICHSLTCAFKIRIRTAITNFSSNPSVQVSGISLVARGRCGTAIHLRPDDSDQRGGVATKRFDDLEVTGLTGSDGWELGIDAEDVTFVAISNYCYRSQVGRGTGIKLHGRNDPVDHHLTSIRILGGQYGIEVSGNTEGVYITKCTMIACESGVYWHPSFEPEPLLALIGSHINSSGPCIRAERLLQPVIQGNLFYQHDTDKRWAGIQIDSTTGTPYDLLNISGNTFHGHPQATEDTFGIYIVATGGGMISGNIFSAVKTGIYLGRQCSQVSVSGVSFLNSPKGTKVQDLGSNNLIQT